MESHPMQDKMIQSRIWGRYGMVPPMKPENSTKRMGSTADRAVRFMLWLGGMDSHKLCLRRFLEL